MIIMDLLVVVGLVIVIDIEIVVVLNVAGLAPKRIRPHRVVVVVVVVVVEDRIRPNIVYLPIHSCLLHEISSTRFFE